MPVITTEELPLRLVVSVHIDENLAAADADPELLWYDITELEAVVAEISTERT